jgi:hypothetical protein
MNRMRVSIGDAVLLGWSAKRVLMGILRPPLRQAWTKNNTRVLLPKALPEKPWCSLSRIALGPS